MTPKFSLPDTPSILIVRLGALGDIIHTLPSVFAIREKYPNAIIDWIVEKRSSEILKKSPLIDSLIEIDTKKWRRDIFNPSLAISASKDFLKTKEKMNKRNYDIAIDFQGLIKSGIFAYLSGAKTSAGFEKEYLREPLNRIFIKKHYSPPGKDIHVIEKNYSLLKSIGIGGKIGNFECTPEMLGANELKESVLKKYNITEMKKTIVGIYPGGGWQSKLWGSENYAQLIEKISQRQDADILLIAGKNEEELISNIAEKTENKPRLILNASIRELAVILAHTGILIGPDTGPLHLAALLGASTVGIYGPSSPLKNGPYWGNYRTVRKQFNCSDCYKRRCDDLRCLKGISVNDVYDAFNGLFEEITTDKNE